MLNVGIVKREFDSEGGGQGRLYKRGPSWPGIDYSNKQFGSPCMCLALYGVLPRKEWRGFKRWQRCSEREVGNDVASMQSSHVHMYRCVRASKFITNCSSTCI